MMMEVPLLGILLAASVAPAAIQELAGRALAAPPEIAADVLIRIADSPKSPDGTWKTEVLETAFQLAPAARHPVKRVAAVALPNPEAVWSVFDRKLDSLSLQVRVVRAMLPRDTERALQLFDRIVLPRIAPLACRDALGYSLHDYYALAAELFPRDSARIIGLARSVESVWQLEPVARMLTRVSLPDDEFRLAVLAYAHALELISSDDRSFAAVISSLRAPVEELGRRLRLPAIDTAWDTLVSRHRSERRCTDPPLAPDLAAAVQDAVLRDADAVLGPPRLR